MRAWLLFAMLFATRPALGDESVSHLLRGAQLFRAEKYSEALVEFRVAEKLGAGGEANWYAAASLVKLKKPLEALETFAAAERSTKTVPDALLTYYRAVACYDARLYVCADQLLTVAGERSGPRTAQQIADTRNSVAAVLKNEASEGTIDWYLQQGESMMKEERAILAELYLREALQLIDRRKTPYRRDAVVQALEKATAKSTSTEKKP